MFTKRDFGSDPTVRTILAETDAFLALQAKKLQAVAKRRGMTDEPRLSSSRVGWWKPDPNPWQGKARVPEMLVRMMLEDATWVTGFPSSRARHNAMIDEACRRASVAHGHGWRPGDTYSYSAAWTTPLGKWSLRNCHGAMRVAGYKPPKAANTLTAFVKIIEAGPRVLDTTGNSTTGERWYASFGEHPHEVRFYSGTEFSYAGRSGNAQWRKGGKSCEPINGSATVYFHDEPGERYALLSFLVKAKAITREEWRLIQEAAQKAKMYTDAQFAIGAWRAKAAELQREQAAQAVTIEADLDALDVFNTHEIPESKNSTISRAARLCAPLRV